MEVGESEDHIQHSWEKLVNSVAVLLRVEYNLKISAKNFSGTNFQREI